MAAPRCLGSAAMVQQRFGYGAEEDHVDDLGVLNRQSGDLLWEREDYVEVLLHRQQLSFAFG